VQLDPAFAGASGRLWGDLARIVQEDFLTWAARPGERFDFLVANPPYVRHHHLSRAQKTSYGQVVHKATGLAPSGLAGLYLYFVLGAAARLAPGAVATWLIPTEFMSVNYGSTLRRYLTEQVTLHRVHVFRADDLQFNDALVTSCVVTYINRPPSPGHEVEFSQGPSFADPSRAHNVPLARLAGSAKWLKCLEAQPNASDEPSLGDFFNIRRGVATGSNAFFVRPRSQFLSLGIPGEYLKPILPSPRHMPLTEVDADRLGWPVGVEPHALLDCAAFPEEALPKAVVAYLRSASDKVRGSYLARTRSPWYAQESRAPAPILCTYMGRSTAKKDNAFRFIRNRSDAVATNSYLMLYPRAEAVEDPAPQWLDQVWRRLAALSTATIIAEGREYGGGLKKIEPKELARVRVPGLGVRGQRQQLF
jgi:hypothetical protein